MDRILEMGTFVAVADAQSFSAAAKKLGLSPPTVTRIVSALEERLGARLLTRTTRSVRLTEAGLRFVDDARRILSEVSDAEQVAAGAQVIARGALRMTAPVLFGEMFVVPVVREFLSMHPQLVAQLMLLDRVINIVEEVSTSHCASVVSTTAACNRLNSAACGACWWRLQPISLPTAHRWFRPI